MTEENKNRQNPNEILPIEIWKKVLDYLPISDLAKSAPTCRLFGDHARRMKELVNRLAGNLVNIIYGYSDADTYAYDHLNFNGEIEKRQLCCSPQEMKAKVTAAIRQLLGEVEEVGVSFFTPDVTMAIVQLMLKIITYPKYRDDEPTYPINGEGDPYSLFDFYKSFLIDCDARAAALLFAAGMDPTNLFDEIVKEDSLCSQLLQSKYRSAHIRLLCQYTDELDVGAMQKISDKLDIFDEVNVVFYAFCMTKTNLYSQGFDRYITYCREFEARTKKQYPSEVIWAQPGMGLVWYTPRGKVGEICKPNEERWGAFVRRVAKDKLQFQEIHCARWREREERAGRLSKRQRVEAEPRAEGPGGCRQS